MKIINSSKNLLKISILLCLSWIHVNEANATSSSQSPLEQELTAAPEAEGIDSSGITFLTYNQEQSGLLNLHRCTEWRINTDEYKYKYNIALDIYIEPEYPSDAIREILFTIIDSELSRIVPGLCDTLPDKVDFTMKAQGGPMPKSAYEYLGYWNSNFDYLINKYNGIENDHYTKEYDSDVILVCRLLMDDSEFATYNVFCRPNYHSNCGDSSTSEYITILKDRNRILTKGDVLSMLNSQAIANSLQNALFREIRSREQQGYSPSLYENIDNNLLYKADGMALVPEGLLVYYYPYNLGCGADGQVDLIIPWDELISLQ